MHDATSDVVEYLPAAHLEHVVAPFDSPVFVIEPGSQVLQYVLPAEPVYSPAAHWMQASVELGLPLTSPYQP